MNHNGHDVETLHRPGETIALLAPGILEELDNLPGDSAVILVERGPNAGSWSFLDEPVISVGRHPNSDIFLDDATTSRRHAEFRRDSDGFRIVDTASLGGVRVNHESVQSALLTHGDEIQVGKFRLLFVNRPFWQGVQ